jgi:type IV fimbrial biogenesis protein FimT
VGLSLVELLVALTIAAILLELAVPTLGRLRAQWAVRGAAGQILAGLQLARRTALTVGQSVTLCPTDDRQRCGLGSSEWMLFTNGPTGSDARREAGEPILREWRLAEGIEVSGTRGYAAYQAQTSAAATVTFSFCHRAHPGARSSLVVSQTGRPRIIRGLPSSASRPSCP